VKKKNKKARKSNLMIIRRTHGDCNKTIKVMVFSLFRLTTPQRQCREMLNSKAGAIPISCIIIFGLRNNERALNDEKV